MHMLLLLYCRGINFVLSALIFNVVPTAVEVAMVSAALVSTSLSLLVTFVVECESIIVQCQYSPHHESPTK